MIAISKGCALPCEQQPEVSTQQLHTLADLIDKGALLVYSKELRNEISTSYQGTGNSWHHTIVNQLFSHAKNRGNLVKSEELPVFAEEENDDDSFSSIDMLVIQLSEAESSPKWKGYLVMEKLVSRGNDVKVVKLPDLQYKKSIDPMEKIIIAKGETIDKVNSLLAVPVKWSQRITVYDQYALKNSMQSFNQGTVSGLERFSQLLVKVRSESGERLHKLEIITNNSPKGFDGKYIKKEQQISGMRELCDRNHLHEWVDQVVLTFTKRSISERRIFFERGGSAKAFDFGKRGLAHINSETNDDPIQSQFVFTPLESEIWRPWKDGLDGLDRQPIEN